jgi:hypothetical protein
LSTSKIVGECDEISMERFYRSSAKNALQARAR